jgi:hypothetical protein
MIILIYLYKRTICNQQIISHLNYIVQGISAFFNQKRPLTTLSALARFRRKERSSVAGLGFEYIPSTGTKDLQHN